MNSCFILFKSRPGIFKNERPYHVYIDIRSVAELHIFEDKKTSLVYGAGTTIGKFRKKLIKYGEKPGFHYFSRVVRHLSTLATVLVRNPALWSPQVGGDQDQDHRRASGSL
ncbi:aldehyde oxidase 4 [Elysia marginata]|uniref:Aldehyde oxidase 4 n=1 Tax=Elysia marginata TaxID=1093978 RepID=A0AAV4JQ24_9GAST|nr:aldehyde oxidase 4 [Elysia marginata]